MNPASIAMKPKISGLKIETSVIINRKQRMKIKPRQAIPIAAALSIMMALSPYFANLAYAATIPSSLQVSVGYADTDHTACSNCFPSPWCGSPGIQFVGSATVYNGNPNDANNCTLGDYDGGAIMLTNTGASSITITDLSVAFPAPGTPQTIPSGDSLGTSGGCHPVYNRPITFSIWFGDQYLNGGSTVAYDGGSITIPAGGEAIFTQTSGGSYCPSGNYPSGTVDFDTSDANFLNGCNPIVGASQEASDPQVTVTASGYDPTTYVDVGHVLDTGGIDPGDCGTVSGFPQFPSEALGWRAITSSCGASCATNQNGVPEFPIGIVAAVAVALVGLAFVRRIHLSGPRLTARMLKHSAP